MESYTLMGTAYLFSARYFLLKLYFTLSSVRDITQFARLPFYHNKPKFASCVNSVHQISTILIELQMQFAMLYKP